MFHRDAIEEATDVQRTPSAVQIRRAQENFWHYGLRVYARPGVESACLALQERCKLNVNQLLFCCWAASYGYGRLNVQEMGLAKQRADDWESRVVSPLRAVRRELKSHAYRVGEASGDRLRREVKRSELFAEKLAQRLLVSTLARAPLPGSSPDALLANLECYLALCGVRPSEDDRADLDTLAKAAGEEMARESRGGAGANQ